MSWYLTLPVTFLSLIIIFFYLAKRRGIFFKLKPVIPYLLTLLYLSLPIAVLKINFVAKIFQSEELDFVLWLLILFFSLVVLVKISTFLVFDFLLSIKRDTKNLRLFRDIFVIILYIIGLLFIANYYLNMKITVVLASSAVLTVVIGFALQDLLGDLFSGVALNFEESLKTGDWVRIGEFEGKIEQLRWRAIILRTVDNVLILIPNQLASKEKVANFGSAVESFALRLGIGASYKNTPGQVIEALHRVLDSVEEVLKKPAPLVLVKEFADFSVNYEIKFWLRDYSVQDIIKSEIRRKTWYEFKRNHIQIPFPIRDVYIKKEQEEKIIDSAVTDLLKNNELFKTIGSEGLTALAEDVAIGLHCPGEILIREGEAARDFYLVIEGEVEVIKNKKVLVKLGSSDYVGEMSLFTGEKTSAAVRVSKESKILKIPSEKFKEAVKINEQTAKKLSQVIALRKAKLSELKKREPLDSQFLKKDSENIFKRMKKYFGI
ncbi:MAG: mechanosensitive ion channel [Candidatus Aminicenantes bacterium]|nr:mechanosensitive ion channel [Candidatus Aminicenantes bacterium]